MGALAHPHRLEIVDALALGDASPGELMRLTGMASSLLAHHVAALEAAGAITRRTSDADARRSYLSLAWDEPIVAAVAHGALAHGAVAHGALAHSAMASDVATHGSRHDGELRHARTPRVVFVCRGNSARSQLAAAIAAHAGLDAASAGTKPASSINPLAIEALAAKGLSPLDTQPRHTSEVLRAGDVVIAVCDHAHASLGAGRVALHWSIPSPSGTDITEFSRAFDDLESRIIRLRAALGAGHLTAA